MQFSVLISVTGNTVDNRYWPSDTTLSDIMRTIQDIAPGIGDDEESAPGDSEYTYLASENGPHGGLYGAVIENIDRARDPRRMAEWAQDRYGMDRELFWATCSDYQASGILDRATFETLMDRLGAVAEDVQTMGTLGGPLGIGIVPDISYNIESQAVIACIRATPISDRINSEERWNMVRDAIMRTHGDYQYNRSA